MTVLNSNKIILTREDLPRLGLNYSPSTLLRWEAAGRFPKRIRFGGPEGRSVGWLASEVIEHLEALSAAREVA
jgi:predicted DNA-binding transcriptional regulator AlpA